MKVWCTAAAAKPGLHSDSLILENLLLVQQEKVKCHVSAQMIPSILNWCTKSSRLQKGHILHIVGHLKKGNY